MHERPLGVEEIELVVKPGPCSSDSGSVGQHAERARDLGQVAARNKGRGFVADTKLFTTR
jgi:hypothetical protein